MRRGRQRDSKHRLVLMSIVIAACSERPATAPHEPTAEAAQPAGLSQRARRQWRTPAAVDLRQPVGIDRVFYDLEGQIPGFGGFMFEGATLVVHLTDPTRNGLAAREIVGAYLERVRGARPSDIQLRRADYGFRQLHAWKASLLTERPQVDIIAADVCEDRNRVCIEVLAGAQRTRRLLAKARRLGIPQRAVIVREGERPELSRASSGRVALSRAFSNLGVTAGRALTHQNLQMTFAAVPGGVMIDDVCTLGFNGMNTFNERTFLTASHCAPPFGTDANAVFGQATDSRRIGVENFDPPTFACTVEGQQQPACRYSDAAEFIYDDTVTWRLGRIAHPEVQNPPTNDIRISDVTPEFLITGTTQFPILGDTVHRVGMVSGWRSGVVNVTCQPREIIVDARSVWLLCQDGYASDIGPGGDSGAPIFRRVAGTNVSLAGIFWGGGNGISRFSSMENIKDLDAFGAYTVTSPP